MEAVLDSRVSEGGPEPGKVGLWLFLLSEVLLFGGFFASYLTLRWGSPDCRLGTPIWPVGERGAALGLAALNTVVLITSSYTMARACFFAARKDGRRFASHLALTLALGLLFLGIKGAEYALKFHHGQYPGGSFALANPGYGIFFSFYFAMTGLHGLHVIAGLAWNALLLRSSQDRAHPDFARKVEYAGLYWHFVDVIWVFLFPLFYLV